MNAMFVFPVNDGMMERLYFMKTSENESVKSAWESLESWEKQIMEMLAICKEERIHEVVLKASGDIASQVEHIRNSRLKNPRRDEVVRGSRKEEFMG